MFLYRASLVLTTSALTLSTLASPPKSETQKFLTLFSTDPAKAMNLLPVKTGTRVPPRFENSLLEQNGFVAAKDDFRKKNFPSASSGGRSAVKDGDHARWLVDNGSALLTKLSQMEPLRAARLPETPWSDDYWALYQGALGKRYNDPAFPGNWKSAFEQVMRDRHYLKLFGLQGSSALDVISPAEKYDLLVGNTSFDFTRANWSEGESYQQQYGSVETWMGLCHGWAAASYMLERPLNAVTLMAADGVTPLTFYPSDIKALATRLWSTVPYYSNFSGGRCNDKNPAVDENGRVISQQCFDTNPGTFHMSLVNQIGVSQRSFVIDATYDYEVWNQPVYSYSYSFFNPQTLTLSDTLEAAIVPVNQFTTDKFKRYRSPNTRYVVGVAMQIGYVVETNPSIRPIDSPEFDSVTDAYYHYDLELDADGNIIGGEWYQNAHPDFLWTPAKGMHLATDFESYAVGPWDTTQPVPAQWREAAHHASRQTLPLAKIVERLIFESRLRK